MNNSDVLREISYDIDLLTRFINGDMPKHLPDQQVAYTTVIEQVTNKKAGFLDAPGGTGKTFITNLLLANIGQRKEIALAVASSGIAAALLPEGRTTLASVKLPLNVINLFAI